MKRNGFPFAAICGAENAKEAILLTLINPHAGGLLLSGEKEQGNPHSSEAPESFWTPRG